MSTVTLGHKSAEKLQLKMVATSHLPEIPLLTHHAQPPTGAQAAQVRPPGPGMEMALADVFSWLFSA